MRSLLNRLSIPAEKLWAIGLVLASTLILIGLAAWTWSDYSDVLADAETIVSATSQAMDHVASSSLQAVDGVLESLVRKIDKDGINSLANGLGEEELKRYARRLPGIGAIYVSDSAGNIVVSVPSRQTPINLSSRQWFRSLQNEKVEPQVGHPVEVGNLFFPVARSIRGPGGIFLGAVEVGVDVAYFAQVFRALDPAFRLDVRSEAKLGLYLAKDGSLVASFPSTSEVQNETVATSPYFSVLANSEGQSWLGWTRDIGKRRLVSARSLRGWPLIVSVSLPEREVYSVARTRLFWRSVIAAMAIGALSLLAVLAHRQARRETVLMEELEHRVKNTLAVVATVIERARENAHSIDELVSSLRARIESMASTQALLGHGRSLRASLADLVRTELRPLATDTNTTVEGPSLYLSPVASRALAMVLHELATNAAKYGALSRPGGHLSVRWRQTTDPRPIIRVEWQESGGPRVVAPARAGYGSTVIRDLLPFELGGTVDLVFAADGVRCTIELPASAGTIV
jgi:two-component sensor histidine kinase